MHKFTRCLLTEWRRLDLPFAGKTYVVAISGGADSVSLALALNELRNRKKLNLRFVLAHFNHNLRGRESAEDTEFVRRLAETFEFELAYRTQNEQIKIENQKGNLEQNARFARYEFLSQIAENLDADGILTAHTLNDQAETFLLNLIRGSGLDGLGGMKTLRYLQNKTQDSKSEAESRIQNPKSKIRLIRPLLRWAKRADTENFCLLNEIEFRNDSMNEDLAFKRVRVRKVLLPLLLDLNPKIIETLGKTAELLRDDAESLAQNINRNRVNDNVNNGVESFFTDTKKKAEDEQDEQDEQNESIEYLVLKELKDVFPSVRRFVLRGWLKNKRGNLRRLNTKHFEAIENLVLSSKSGQKIELPGDEFVLKKGGKLFYKKREVEKS